MARNIEEQRANAELRFKKSQAAAAIRGQAMAEYEAEAKATRAKSERLKMLRLAKQAEDEAAVQSVQKAPKRTRKAPKRS